MGLLWCERLDSVDLGDRSDGRLLTSSTKDTMRSQLSVTPEVGPHRTLLGSECIFPKQLSPVMQLVKLKAAATKNC